jgi:1-aminocyclopropane-1-carboxylate deaminase/D-cysteine desulfhydrase-like pyridoxal-dependent ACC family enzyme
VDFLIGDAIKQGASALVTLKATSFSRNAAAAASACGLELHVVLSGRASEQNPLSQSLFAAFGAHLHYEENVTALAEHQSDLVARLRVGGKAVYVLHPGGSDSVGALSYVSVLDEISAFSERTGIHFSRVIHSTSSAGTQAGLIVGQQIADYAAEIIGVSASRQAGDQSKIVLELAEQTARLLGTPLDAARVIVDDGFVGPGYAQVSPEGEAATRLFVQLEGIFLDSVYTGKAAAAMLDYAQRGMLGEEPVLFLHTGGNGGLYY